MTRAGRFSRCGLRSLLVGLALTGVTFLALSESTAEIAYDDGTADAQRAYALAGGGFAARFTPNAVGDTLLRARFYVAELHGAPAPIEVHIWDVEKNDVVPPVLATVTALGWFDVDFSGAQLVLTDDVYVGYLQTSAEDYPWLGLDYTTVADRSYGLPEWNALLPAGACAMIRILTQRALASEEGLELSYDDGTAEAGRGYAMPGAGYAVRFTPPTGGAALDHARIFITGFQGNPAPIEVHVWDAEGKDLIAPLDALPTEAGWYSVDLSAALLRVSADISVGYLQMDGENYPWLGVDIGNPNDRSFSVPGWNLLLPSGANAMIRIAFADVEP